MRLRRLSVGTLVLSLLASSLSSSLLAQQGGWEDLNARVLELTQQGKYAEALPLAEESLRLAEATFGAEHPNMATALNNLAEVYRFQGRYADAEPLYQRALRIQEKGLGPEHPEVAASLNNLAGLYQDRGRYTDAEPLFQRALQIREKALGPAHPEVAQSLNNLGELYRSQSKYAEAEPLHQRALQIREKALGPEHPDVGESLNNLALLYRRKGKDAEAEPLYRRSLLILEKALGPDHPTVAATMNNLAALYRSRARYAEAEPLYQRALGIWEKALGPEHPDVAVALNNLAGLYQGQGRYAEAEPLYQRSVRIREKALGPEHPNVSTALNDLAGLYRDQGRYAEAEPLYQRSLRIREKALGPEHPNVGASLNNLAVLYVNQSKYAEAEPLYQRALGIWEKALGPEHPNVAVALNNLAALYRSQARYLEAEPLYQRSLDIREKALGPEHPNVAGALNNLAALYDDQGKYAEAEALYQRALAIWEKALGPEHPNVAASLNNLAELHVSQGKYVDAEPLYQRALRIWEKALGPEHPDVASALNNLGLLYWNQEKYTDAEPLHQRALQIREKVLGPEHPAVAWSLHNLGLLQYARQAPDQAEPLFARSFDILFHQFQYLFTYMSEKERLGFLSLVADRFPLYFSFVHQFREKRPLLTGRMYDLLLWQKGFIVGSLAALRRQIEASGDPEAIRLLEELAARRTQIATLLGAQPADRERWRKRLEQLNGEANELERALVQRSAAFAGQKKLERVPWQRVRDELKPGEAAVELVRFQFHDGKKWTGRAYYVALVVTPETIAAPTFILLGDAAQLEGAPLRQYRGLVRPERASKDSAAVYEAFWKPLEVALGERRRIYLSPDGVLNQVAWGILPGRDRRPLVDHYDLHIVSSTKDILRQPAVAKAMAAVLIGNPTFELSKDQQRAALESLTPAAGKEQLLLLAQATPAPGQGLRSQEATGATLPTLPGTDAEVKAINSLLSKRKWQTVTYTEASALEEVVKRLQHPRVLHLATHGFFLPDQENKSREGLGQGLPPGLEDPMLRSGLFFAGAGRTLAGQGLAPDLDDGILTAYEATGLNLQGTELVVLSACETGLGQVRNGEGVFGLRRALQVAGAETVLMSLWAVPDRETQELMSLFYQQWLGGREKHEALRRAQLELRAKVKARYGEDIPFYWGAFVLVGR